MPPVLVFITLIVFGLMKVSPGDPVAIMLGVYATPESVATLEREFYLDRPAIVQYVLWLRDLVTGDLGYSIRTREQVRDIITTRFPISLSLAAAATLISLVIAIPTGVIAAARKNTALDYGLMAFTMIGLSIPNFAFALILILIFALNLGWVPISGIGFYSLRDDPVRALMPFVLPTVALAFPLVAEMARLVRTSMLEVLSKDYIRVAQAKGVSASVLLGKHALRNALLPLVTITTINFAYLVGTTITIEFVFAIPGIGTALIQAVLNRDFPVIQGVTLVIALFFIVTNILADVLYVVIDPRVSYA